MCLFLDRSKATPLSQQFYINGIRHGPDEENVLWSHFILYLKREGAVPQNSEVKQTGALKNLQLLFISGLFIITKTWRQPRCSSVGKLINCGTFIPLNMIFFNFLNFIF